MEKEVEKSHRIRGNEHDQKKKDEIRRKMCGLINMFEDPYH